MSMFKYKLFFKASLGIVALMVLAMLYTTLFSSPEKIVAMDIVRTFMWYRIAGFALLVASWHWVCQWITRKQPYEYDLPEEKQVERQEKRENDYRYLVSLRWKVAVFCVFFEAVVIQQLRFLSW